MAGDVPLRDAAQALLDAIKNRLDEGNQYGSGAFDEGYSAALTDVIAHPAASQLRAALAAADTAPVHNHDYDHGYRQGFRDGLRQNGHDIDALVAAAADEPPRRRRSPEGADHGE